MRPLIGLITLLLASMTNAQLIPDAPQVERVATGMQFTEGPALGADGAIYFSDIPNRKVHRFDPPTGETTVFMEDSGGSNGLHWDGAGRLILCADKSRKVTRRDTDGTIMTIAETFDGKKFNSPNDLDIASDGGVYFTDPSWAKRENRDMDEMAVYYLPSPIDAAKPKQIITDVKKPNGIALSLDETLLYVADNDGGVVYAYDLTAPGEVSNKREFARPAEGVKGGPDGMTIDRMGNLYAAWHGAGAVHVWSPEGEHLGHIEVPKDGEKAVQPTNVEFAQDGETLYITGGGSLYRVKLDVPKPH